MAVVYYRNGKTGRTYAYESKAVWNSELGYSVPERKYLGRVDENGNIIPSSGRPGRKASPADERKEERKSSLEKENEALRSENIRLKGELESERREKERLSLILGKIHKLTV